MSGPSSMKMARAEARSKATNWSFAPNAWGLVGELSVLSALGDELSRFLGRGKRRTWFSGGTGVQPVRLLTASAQMVLLETRRIMDHEENSFVVGRNG